MRFKRLISANSSSQRAQLVSSGFPLRLFAVRRLPQYLTVQMVRFFYKAATQQKAKILRKVCSSPLSGTAALRTPAFA